ncbi:Rossmann-fold NAD(P)-binding domain-containing protein [Paraburkholderia kirstenboschensis]|uniref:Uncharacterized protein n=1 Tax=Paraburkholderia kirstenboschensis TaxID=1245436 RepID=A0ABZ0E8A1_9BURK|nr:hypothetical protein [Paraburkholderia kirstenboschensis]WOD13480.1 hypothetical protein RW095_05555 [Paraburkholderia kirstenboschensis]
MLSSNRDVISASRKGSAIAVDISSKESITAMYRQTQPLEAVVCVAGTARFAPLDTLAG